MEFDKSKVYTAVNADELPIGSMCIFGDTIVDLQKGLDAGEEFGLIWPLEEVFDEYEVSRFKNERGRHILAYLVELPAKPKYRPFTSSRSLTKAIGKHGNVIKTILKRDGLIDSDIINMNEDEGTIILANVCDQFRLTSQELLDGYVFASDGSPCGELVEEGETKDEKGKD